MAERYTRYESKGIGARFSLPSSAGQTAVVNSYNQMSSMLDSMAKTFYGEAVKEKKIEGAEYGALNAPTEKQLEHASANNIDLDLVGDNSTVFGRSARMAVLEATSDKLTVLAQKKMSSIIVNGTIADLTPDEISLQLDAVISGYVGSLETESPTTALKLKAQLGINANSRYVAYAKSFVTAQKEKALVSYVETVDRVLNEDLPLLIKNGMTKKIVINEGGDTKGSVTTATTVEVINKLMNNVLSTAPQNLDKTTARQIPKDFKKRVLEISENIIRDEIFASKEPEKLYSAILSGKYDKLSIELQSALSVLEGKDKYKAQGWVQDAIEKKESYKLNQIKNAETYRNEDIRLVEVDINKALSTADDTNRNKLFDIAVSKLEKIDPVKAKEYKELYSIYKTSNEDDTVSEFRTTLTSDTTLKDTIKFELSSFNPRITVLQLNKALMKGKLSRSDFEEFSEKVLSRNDKSFTRAMKRARTHLKIPNAPFIQMGNEQSGQSKARAILNNIEEAMLTARKNDPNFNANDWIDRNLESYANKGKSDSERELKDLKSLAEGYSSQEKLEQEISYATDKEYKDSLIRDLRQIQQYLYDNSDAKIKNFKKYDHRGNN